MIVYHGSWMEVSSPDTIHSRKAVDFGQGFYVTPIWEQAEKWSERFKRSGKKAVVSCYQLDDAAFIHCKCLRFETYSEGWLDFILSCRTEKDTSCYDIVIGGVANDKVYNTVELYFENLIDKGEAIKRLQYEKPNLQICLRTQTVIEKYLTFEGSKTI